MRDMQNNRNMELVVNNTLLGYKLIICDSGKFTMIKLKQILKIVHLHYNITKGIVKELCIYNIYNLTL